MQNQDSWFEATVAGVRDLTPQVRELHLSVPGRSWDCAPGAHIPVSLGPSSAPMVRHYSLLGRTEAGDYRIAVRHLPSGRGGSRAMWDLAQGEQLRVGAPRNDFPLDWSAPAYLLVAGGIGVTPLLPMARALMQRGAEVRMVYAARPGHAALLDELHGLLGDRLRGPAAGRPDFAQLFAGLTSGTQAYVCGPVAMLEAARAAWQAAGHPAEDLRFETFGSAADAEAPAFRVRLPRHQIDLTVGPQTSLLEALERAGVAALSDCRRGECGLCALDVVAVNGHIEHRDVYLSPREKAANERICVCVSRAVGELTLDSAWRPDR